MADNIQALITTAREAFEKKAGSNTELTEKGKRAEEIFNAAFKAQYTGKKAEVANIQSEEVKLIALEVVAALDAAMGTGPDAKKPSEVKDGDLKLPLAGGRTGDANAYIIAEIANKMGSVDLPQNVKDVIEERVEKVTDAAVSAANVKASAEGLELLADMSQKALAKKEGVAAIEGKKTAAMDGPADALVGALETAMDARIALEKAKKQLKTLQDAKPPIEADVNNKKKEIEDEKDSAGKVTRKGLQSVADEAEAKVSQLYDGSEVKSGTTITTEAGMLKSFKDASNNAPPKESIQLAIVQAVESKRGTDPDFDAKWKKAAANMKINGDLKNLINSDEVTFLYGIESVRTQDLKASTGQAAAITDGAGAMNRIVSAAVGLAAGGIAIKSAMSDKGPDEQGAPKKMGFFGKVMVAIGVIGGVALLAKAAKGGTYAEGWNKGEGVVGKFTEALKSSVRAGQYAGKT